MSIVYDDGSFHGIRPAKYDKDGPLYSEEDVDSLTSKSINSGFFLKKKAKNMTDGFDQAAETLDKSYKTFKEKAEQFRALEEDFAAKSKKASGSVRDATQKLADGLARIEKTANFEKLERITALLERAEKALSALAELEKAGKLEKISSLLK